MGKYGNKSNKGEGAGFTIGLIGALAGQGEGRRNLANQLALICQKKKRKRKKLSRQMFGFFGVSGDSLIAGYTR